MKINQSNENEDETELIGHLAAGDENDNEIEIEIEIERGEELN
jgi:hypothetical protein